MTLYVYNQLCITNHNNTGGLLTVSFQIKPLVVCILSILYANIYGVPFFLSICNLVIFHFVIIKSVLNFTLSLHLPLKTTYFAQRISLQKDNDKSQSSSWLTSPGTTLMVPVGNCHIHIHLPLPEISDTRSSSNGSLV